MDRSLLRLPIPQHQLELRYIEGCTTPMTSSTLTPQSGLPSSSTTPLLPTPNIAEIERRYTEIKKRSGFLKIMGVEHKCHLSDIEEIRKLGEGSFGVVIKAKCKKTSTFMAIKKIPLSQDALHYKRTIMDMDVVMRAHDCPHIVRCYGCFVEPTEVWICMEIMAMGLDQLLSKIGYFPEKIVGKIAHSAILALLYLKESEKIIHRDVKPANILIDLHGTFKLCDFGISGRLIDTNCAETNSKGTIAYLAPERIGGMTKYGVKSDIWSLGITLMELATGRHPYDDCSISNLSVLLLLKIQDNPTPKLKPSKKHSKEFCTFLSYCLQKKPEDRLNYNSLLEKPFLIQAIAESETNVETWFHTVYAMSQ